MAFHQIEKLKPLSFRSKASLLLILFIMDVTLLYNGYNIQRRKMYTLSPLQSQKSSRYSMERFIASRGNVAAVADEKEAEHVGAESWGAA